MTSFSTDTGTNPEVGAKRTREFFRLLSPWSSCYRGLSIAVFGQVRDGTVDLYRARVRLRCRDATPTEVVRSGHYLAARMLLRGGVAGTETIVARLVNGETVRIRRDLAVRLPADESSGIYVEPPSLLHPEGIQTNRRLSVLTVVAGTPGENMLAPELGWALRTSKRPFDSVQELLQHFELGLQTTNRCSLDVVADTPAGVWLESRVDGDTARLGLWLPRGLRRTAARLTYSVFSKGVCVDRACVTGRNMKWARRDDVSIGQAAISVPRAAIVRCNAIYADEAHHSLWIGDPDAFQNPRLAALDTIDKGQQVLRRYLLPSESKGNAQQQFESAVAWLLWTLGLSVVQTDRADQTKEGPDVIAVAPGGGQLLVECTLGLLKAESKLAKIARRAVDVRLRLDAAGLAGTAVVPVIVTALQGDRVAPEVDAATSAGVVVVAREYLESALGQMLLFPDGDRVFRQAQDALRNAQEELRRKQLPAAGGTQ